MVRMRWPRTAIYIIATSLGILGCNDSGSEAADLYIDTSNQEIVIATLFDSIDATSPQFPSDQNGTDTEVPFSLALDFNDTDTSTQSGDTVRCSGGGMIYIEVDGDESHLSYEDCQEAENTTNGDINVVYDQGSGALTYTLKDYSHTNAQKTYSTASTTHTVSSGRLSYSTNGSIKTDHDTITFSGYDYVLDMRNNRLNVTVNGSLKTTGLREWFSVKTQKALQFSQGGCPDSGELEVSGSNAKLKMLFKEDQSIDVYLNNTLSKQYANCEQIPDLTDFASKN